MLFLGFEEDWDVLRHLSIGEVLVAHRRSPGRLPDSKIARDCEGTSHHVFAGQLPVCRQSGSYFFCLASTDSVRIRRHPGLN